MARAATTRMVVGTLVALLSTLGVLAGTISLEWDPVPEAEGYRVYYGTSSGQYTDYVNVGNTTSTTLNVFADCTTYFLAVKAFNSSGESDSFSEEISGWARPEIHTVSPSARRQGSQFTLEIQGANFMTGADLEIDNPNVFVESVSSSCDRVTAALTVEPTSRDVRPAEIGTFRIEIVNPDQVYGAEADAFEVQIEPERFDINVSTETSRGRVDGQDTIWLASNFGAEEGSASYDPDCDLDGNGWVDGDDLSFLAAEFGRCWNVNQNRWDVGSCPESAK